MHMSANLHNPSVRKVSLLSEAKNCVNLQLGDSNGEYTHVNIFFEDVDELGKWLSSIEAQRINLIAQQLISA
jgi:hypothetical protein